jgi:hypothetical protein
VVEHLAHVHKALSSIPSTQWGQGQGWVGEFWWLHPAEIYLHVGKSKAGAYGQVLEALGVSC